MLETIKELDIMMRTVDGDGVGEVQTAGWRFRSRRPPMLETPLSCFSSELQLQ